MKSAIKYLVSGLLLIVVALGSLFLPQRWFEEKDTALFSGMQTDSAGITPYQSTGFAQESMVIMFYDWITGMSEAEAFYEGEALDDAGIRMITRAFLKDFAAACPLLSSEIDYWDQWDKEYAEVTLTSRVFGASVTGRYGIYALYGTGLIMIHVNLETGTVMQVSIISPETDLFIDSCYKYYDKLAYGVQMGLDNEAIKKTLGPYYDDSEGVDSETDAPASMSISGVYMFNEGNISDETEQSILKEAWELAEQSMPQMEETRAVAARMLLSQMGIDAGENLLWNFSAYSFYDWDMDLLLKEQAPYSVECGMEEDSSWGLMWYARLHTSRK